MSKIQNSVHLNERSKALLIEYVNQAGEDFKSLAALKIVFHLTEIVEKTKSSDPITKANEVIKGAHIIIDNGIELFNVIKESTDNVKGRSSHYIGQKKAEIRLNIKNVNKEILIGLTKDNQLFLQLENTPIRFERSHLLQPNQWMHDIRNIIKHLLDYIAYRITKKNIGWVDKSPHTDKTPITLSDEYLETLKGRLKEQEKNGIAR
jgi:hypothetical protein